MVLETKLKDTCTAKMYVEWIFASLAYSIAIDWWIHFMSSRTTKRMLIISFANYILKIIIAIWIMLWLESWLNTLVELLTTATQLQ